MPKPTLVQTLLGRPSQSYSLPAEKSAYYHSTKPELFRLYARRGAHDVHAASARHRRSSSEVFQQVRSRATPLQHPNPPTPLTGYPTVPEAGQDTCSTSTCSHLPQHHRSLDDDDESKDSDSDSNDVFFTPNTSPRISMISSTSITVSPPSAVSKPTDPPHPPLAPSTSTISLSSTIVTSTDSLFSSTSVSRSDSTRITSPVGSKDGHSFRKQSSLQAHGKPSSPDSEFDPNWSKNVRWLVQPPPSESIATPAISTIKPRFHARTQSMSSRRLTKTLAQATPSIMMSMAALLEEEENPTRDGMGNLRVHTHSPRSSVIITPPGGRRFSSTPFATTRTGPRLSSVPELRHRFGSEVDVSRSSSLRTTTSQVRNGTLHADEPEATPSHSRSHSTISSSSSRRHSRRESLSPLLATPYTPSLPSHGTPGYTSLVLPRAPPPPSLSLTPATHTGSDGRVDLTLGGIAQTTMATVEVVRGLGASSSKGMWSTLSKRRTIRGSLRTHSDRRLSGESSMDESLSRGDMPLAFAGHRAPPKYVGPSSVLVQVWAVGVDGVDGMLVAEKSGTSMDKSKGKGKAEVGYVPGRSFVGRVLECGWEVREEDVRKGEWVIGLLDVRKCGALAEFIVVDRHRVQRIPYPRMHSPDESPSTATASPSLTLQEYALLPLCGVPAHRAVRACVSVLPGKSRRRRALVLRGHDGAGAFATQIFIRRGWRVCVHAPIADRDRTDDDGHGMSVEARVRAWGADGVVFDDGQPGAAVRVLEMLIEDGDVFDAVVDTIGGRDVWEAGSRLLRAGGRGGVFTTLVGDVVGRAVPSAGDHFRAGIRSLRRASGGVSGEKGNAGDGEGGKVEYVWVSVKQDVDWDGEDVRESLRAVLALALERGTRPWTGMVVPFERSPEVFGGCLATLGSGRTVVVKVVG